MSMLRRVVALVTLLLAVLSQGQGGPEAFAPARSWALVLGAGKYTKLAPLQFAASDAHLFTKSLIEDLGFDPKTVRTVADDTDGPDKLSSKNILAELDAMIHDRRIDPGHLFVFYFSGHGIGTPQGDYLCPTNADVSNVTEIGVPVKALIKKLVDAGMHNVLFIADACREGNKNPFGKELRELGRAANIAVFLGCAPGKRSYENPRTGHGYFTAAIAKVLKDDAVRGEKYGALWASAVAAKVVEQVSASTERQFGENKQVPATWSEPQQDVLLALVPPPIGQGDAYMRDLVKTAQDRGKETYTKLLRVMMQSYIDARDFKNAVEVGRSLEGLGQLTPSDRGALAGIYRFLGREREAQSLCAELVKNSPDSFVRDMALLWWVDSSVTAQMRRDAVMRMWQVEQDFATADMVWQHWAYVDPAGKDEVLAVADKLVKHFGDGTRVGTYFRARKAQYLDDFKQAAELVKEARAMPGEHPAERVMLDMEFELLRKTKDYDRMLVVAARGMAVDLPDRWLLNLVIGFTDAPLAMRKRVARLALATSNYGPNYIKAVGILRSEAYLLKDEIAKVAKENPDSVYAQCAVMIVRVAEKFEVPLVRQPELERLWTGDLQTAGYLYGAIYEAAREAWKNKRIDEERYRLVSEGCLLPFLERLADIQTGLLSTSHVVLFTMPRETSGQAALIADRALMTVLTDPQTVGVLRALWLRRLYSAGRLDLATKVVDSGGWNADKLLVEVRLCTSLGLADRWDESVTRFNKLKPDSDKVTRQTMWALAHLSRITLGYDKDLADIDANAAKITDANVSRLVWMCRMAFALGRKDERKPDGEVIKGLLPAVPGLIQGADKDYEARTLILAWRGQAAVEPARHKRDEFVLLSEDARQGNPLFDDLPWCVPSQVGDFAGKTVLEGTARFDGRPDSVPARLTVEATKDGKATFTVEREGKPPVVLTGTVTRFGGFRGADGKTSVAGRLMPASVAKLRPDVARAGVRMALWDENCAQWTFHLDVPR